MCDYDINEIKLNNNKCQNFSIENVIKKRHKILNVDKKLIYLLYSKFPKNNINDDNIVTIPHKYGLICKYNCYNNNCKKLHKNEICIFKNNCHLNNCLYYHPKDFYCFFEDECVFKYNNCFFNHSSKNIDYLCYYDLKCRKNICNYKHTIFNINKLKYVTSSQKKLYNNKELNKIIYNDDKIIYNNKELFDNNKNINNNDKIIYNKNEIIYDNSEIIFNSNKMINDNNKIICNSCNDINIAL